MGEGASGDGARALLPCGWRRRSGEGVALVVYDEQALAVGVERGGGGGALFGSECCSCLLERVGEPQFDGAFLSACGDEWLACRVERDARDRAGRGEERVCDLIAAAGIA